MLTGRLPFGTEVVKATTKAAQRRLTYRSLLDDEREIPAWIDETMKRATHPDPEKRIRSCPSLYTTRVIPMTRI